MIQEDGCDKGKCTQKLANLIFFLDCNKSVFNNAHFDVNASTCWWERSYRISIFAFASPAYSIHAYITVKGLSPATFFTSFRSDHCVGLCCRVKNRMIWVLFRYSNECNLLHLIAADTSRHKRTCSIIYFQGMVRNQSVFHSVALAWKKTNAATLRVFRADY